MKKVKGTMKATAVWPHPIAF